MYHNVATTRDAFHYFEIRISPKLLELLQRPSPPTVEEPLSCTIEDVDLSAEWLVYQQFVRNDNKPKILLYCGSSVNNLGGGERLFDYDAYFSSGTHQSVMPKGIKYVKREDIHRIGVCVIACAKIPETALDHRMVHGLLV